MESNVEWRGALKEERQEAAAVAASRVHLDCLVFCPAPFCCSKSNFELSGYGDISVGSSDENGHAVTTNTVVP